MIKLALASWAIAGCAGLLTIVVVRGMLSGARTATGATMTVRPPTREVDYSPGLKAIAGRVGGWTYGLLLFFGTFYQPCDTVAGAVPCGQSGPGVTTIAEFVLLLILGLLTGKKVLEILPAYRRRAS